eukprot:TRINITY_DN20434_c0_g1_i1.p1 TRINITY_DN20434_c0_g1~~TRINITY_DN20434_c0_g1_i1.p1  ORF type:complete len:319 (+),score=64.19 TRINITY_DN20434_c0_g1_i1:46-957(+)
MKVWVKRLQDSNDEALRIKLPEDSDSTSDLILEAVKMFAFGDSGNVMLKASQLMVVDENGRQLSTRELLADYSNQTLSVAPKPGVLEAAPVAAATPRGRRTSSVSTPVRRSSSTTTVKKPHPTTPRAKFTNRSAPLSHLATNVSAHNQTHATHTSISKKAIEVPVARNKMRSPPRTPSHQIQPKAIIETHTSAPVITSSPYQQQVIDKLSEIWDSIDFTDTSAPAAVGSVQAPISQPAAVVVGTSSAQQQQKRFACTDYKPTWGASICATCKVSRSAHPKKNVSGCRSTSPPPDPLQPPLPMI